MIIEEPKCPDCSEPVVFVSTVKRMYKIHAIEDGAIIFDNLVCEFPADVDDERLVCRACNWEGEPHTNTFKED